MTDSHEDRREREESSKQEKFQESHKRDRTLVNDALPTVQPITEIPGLSKDPAKTPNVAPQDEK